MSARSLLILGGYGRVGGRLAQLLLASTDVRLVLGGRHLERAEAAAAEWNSKFDGGRVRGIWTDSTDPELLRQDAFRNIDLVIVASGTSACAEDIAAAALQAGIDYLDIHPSQAIVPRLRSMSSSIEKAGRCFITAAGFHPGLPSALVRYAGQRVEGLESAFVGALVHPQWKQASQEAILELLDDFKSRRQPRETRKFDFGDSFGVHTCRPAPLDEMRALPEMITGLRQASFYVAGFGAFVDGFVASIAPAVLKVSKRKGWRRMARLVRWGLPRPSSLPQGAALKLEAAGERSFALTVRHADEHFMAAAAVTACLLQYLDGSIRKPGLHRMGHVVDPARLLEDLKRLGVSVTQFVGRVP